MVAGTPVLSFEAAEKRYRRSGREVVALDGLTFEVAGPGVHGLVGPNGSGKTTAMRALVGHVRLTSGSASLFGTRDDAPPLHESLRRTGALLEAPRFYGRHSARTALDLHRRLCATPPVRVEEVLEVVGLAARADDRIRTYSSGMKQRLGIGVALLSDPDLLVVDEPSNGLDPSGMRRLRTVLRELGDRGRTVLVSSHLLADLQLICDSVTVVAAGRCRFNGPVSALPVADRVGVGVEGRPDLAAAVLRAHFATGVGVEQRDDQLVVTGLRTTETAVISRVLAANGVHLTSLVPQPGRLEDAFEEMVAATLGPDVDSEWGAS